MFPLISTSTGKKNAILCSCTSIHFAIRNYCHNLQLLIPDASVFLFLSRGMKFENVQILTDAISDIITDMKWAW